MEQRKCKPCEVGMYISLVHQPALDKKKQPISQISSRNICSSRSVLLCEQHYLSPSCSARIENNQSTQSTPSPFPASACCLRAPDTHLAVLDLPLERADEVLHHLLLREALAHHSGVLGHVVRALHTRTNTPQGAGRSTKKKKEAGGAAAIHKTSRGGGRLGKSLEKDTAGQSESRPSAERDTPRSKQETKTTIQRQKQLNRMLCTTVATAAAATTITTTQAGTTLQGMEGGGYFFFSFASPSGRPR